MRRFSFSVITTVCCLSFVQASAQQVLNTPILHTLRNFRDIAGISVSNGGSVYTETTVEGGTMRPGVFYRSNAPSFQNISPDVPVNFL